jgi:hypothetical protein
MARLDGLDARENALHFLSGQNLGQTLLLLWERDPLHHLRPTQRDRVEAPQRGNVVGTRSGAVGLLSLQVQQVIADFLLAELQRRNAVVVTETLNAANVATPRVLLEPFEPQVLQHSQPQRTHHDLLDGLGNKLPIPEDAREGHAPKAAQTSAPNETQGRDQPAAANAAWFKAHYYAIARGSALETAAAVDVLAARRLASADACERVAALARRVALMLGGLIRSMERRAS